MRRNSHTQRRLSIEPLERREVLYAGVSPIIEIQTNFGNIEFELLEDSAPRTVENFLTYVESGDYENVIFHRLVDNFVLQGGGFSVANERICDSESCLPSDVDADNFREVTPLDPIVNEFNVSNTIGTVAMAKLGGDPDSATNQWFINLQDNSGNLDNQNGGFTVFARVVDMTPVNEIVSFDTINVSSEFPRGDRRGAIVNAPVVSENGETRIVAIQGFGGSGVVHGTAFLDVNRNGVRDASDGGRGGLVVFNDTNNNGVLDAEESRTTTDATGDYHLFIPNGDPYRLRMLPGEGYASTDQGVNTGSVAVGRTVTGVNFGTEFLGTTFHNDRTAEDVDGVNGVTPLDALIVINELTDREFSDADSGNLVTLTDPLASPRFLDVNDDGNVAPLDALAVINFLNGATPNAPLSVSAGDDATLDRGIDAAGYFAADEEDRSENELTTETLIDLALLDLTDDSL